MLFGWDMKFFIPIIYRDRQVLSVFFRAKSLLCWNFINPSFEARVCYGADI